MKAVWQTGHEVVAVVPSSGPASLISLRMSLRDGDIGGSGIHGGDLDDLLGCLEGRGGEQVAWGFVGSVVCRKVPAGAVKVTRCSRSSLVRMVGQVRAVSVTRIGSRVSQHSRTWVRMRSSRRW